MEQSYLIQFTFPLPWISSSSSSFRKPSQNLYPSTVSITYYLFESHPQYDTKTLNFVIVKELL